MAKQSGQKVRILYIIDYLRRYSDEQHPVSTPQIIEYLENNGIEAERKSVYRDIDILIDYGYDIIKNRGTGGGYFLSTREFEEPEIRLLTDAVASAGFITAKKSRELTAKLEKIQSVHQARRHRDYSYIDISHKCKNEEIYYTIDRLSDAVEGGKKVSLRYERRILSQDRRVAIAEKEMEVSPYALIWQDDCYYLVCNNAKYDNLMNLRLDRMRAVKILDTPARHFSEVSEYKDAFNISDYVSKNFNMFSGEPTEIKLRCDTALLEQVIDRFGEDIFYLNVENGHFDFNVKANLSEGLVSWILQFGAGIKALAPNEFVDMVKKRIDDLYEIYN